MVGKEVAARAVATWPPQKAAVVLLQDVAQHAEGSDVLHLPRVVVQTLPALGDADSVMVGIATQEEQGAVAHIVGEAEPEHLLDELLRLSRPFRLEHRMTELARLHALAGVTGLVLTHPRKDLEDMAVGAREAD